MNQAPKRFETSSPRQSTGQAASQAKGMMDEYLSTAQHTISDNPSTAVFTAFAAGFGVGLGLALAFSAASAPPPGMREQFSQFLSEHMPAWAKMS